LTIAMRRSRFTPSSGIQDRISILVMERMGTKFWGRLLTVELVTAEEVARAADRSLAELHDGSGSGGCSAGEGGDGHGEDAEVLHFDEEGFAGGKKGGCAVGFFGLL